MARVTGSSLKVFSLVLGIVFSMAALTVTFAAANRATQLRSKAAEESVTVKQWEFNGTGTEGWQGASVDLLRAFGGFLYTRIVKGQTSVSISHPTVAAQVPIGLKSLNIRLAVHPASRVASYLGRPQESVTEAELLEKITAANRQSVKGSQSTSSSHEGSVCVPRPACLDDPVKPCQLFRLIPGWCPPTPKPTPACIPRPACLDTSPACKISEPVAGWCKPYPKISPTPLPTKEPPKPTAYTITLTYGKKGKSGMENPLILQGVADGQLHEYTFHIPDIGLIEIQKLQMEFSGLRANDVVGVDWIRIIGTKERPPTPTPGGLICNETIQPPLICPVGYRCTYEGSLLGANGRCVKSVPTPTPVPAGCSYKQVNCTGDLCESVLVCPPQPTPTGYLCPPGEWVDCMPLVADPGTTPVERPNCTNEYLTWAQANCPLFKGAAY